VRRTKGQALGSDVRPAHPPAEIIRTSLKLEIALDGAVPRTSPSSRPLIGIALILLLIVAWAAFVASLAHTVGRWPVLLQAVYYLFMGLAWILPLKPLVRWIQTGRFRAPPE
jgi:hypothetical protein